MRSISSPMAALFASGEFIMADLYEFQTLDGLVLRWTDADALISAGGVAYQVGPTLRRNRIRLTVGLEVDTLEIEGQSANPVASGMTFQAAARAGLFDGAKVTVRRAIMGTFGDTSAGTLPIFSGRVADVDVAAARATLQVRSDLDLLTTKLPRALYQAQCTHTVYDAGCGKSKAAMTQAKTAQAGSTATRVLASGATAGYWDQGVMAFTSGALAGTRRSIKRSDGSAFIPLSPLPAAPAAGDAFTVYPGCDRSKSACSAKFNNLSRFRGCPYIPQPETTL